ncbi:unnamed protein product, partial [Ixodes persulcatus]
MERPNTTRIFRTIHPKVAANSPRFLGCCLNQSNLSINKRTEPTLATKRPRALFRSQSLPHDSTELSRRFQRCHHENTTTPSCRKQARRLFRSARSEAQLPH